MLRLLPLSLLVLVPLVAQARAQNPVEKEVQKLTGLWLIAVDETDGHRADARILKQARVTITRDQLVVQFGDVRYAMNYTLKPGTSPAQIDLTTMVRDVRSGNTMIQRAGVYELDGDTLRMATSLAHRPERIRPGRGVQYWELKRSK